MAEGVLILVVLIVIVLIMPKGTPNPDVNSPTSNIPNSNSSGGASPEPNSSYARYIYLGTGNATFSFQPYEEYVTINNSSSDPINITGWQLKNGKNKRAYDFGGDLRYFPADTATIPQATLFISPSSFNTFQDVILQNGEQAIVTTGLIGSQLPYKIVSFKENICSGFLEDLSEYAFTPPLEHNCPRPADEPGVRSLGTECQRFIERMPSCHTPAFNTRDREGDICSNCVDSTLLSSSCVAFIKEHFNYSSCIAYHQHDSNFSSRTWRIFLGRSWEMWADKYETIELFDQLGRLVDYRTY